MQTKNRFFSDVTKLAGGALGTLDSIRREVEEMARHQLERMLSKLDLVTRDEFDAIKEMAVKARQEQAKINSRLAKIESQGKKKNISGTRKRKTVNKQKKPKSLTV